MNLELVMTGPRRRGPEPVIRIYRTGQIALNQAAYEALGSPRYVELYRDRDRSRIAIRPVPVRTKHARVLTPWRRGGAVLTAKPLVRELPAADLPLHVPAAFDGEYLAASLSMENAA